MSRLLNKNEFEILLYLTENSDLKITQRLLSKKLDLSLGMINKTILTMIDKKYIDDSYNILDLGMKLLDNYKVSRAVILGAGFGERLMPITLNTPKPLIMVNGERVIETLLNALLDTGITEIILVRGYLKHQFDYLKTLYPSLTFIDNDEYIMTKNISSAYLAKEYFNNAYIFEADLILKNKNIIKPYMYQSTYFGKLKPVTDKWVLNVEGGYIDEYKIGGSNTFEMAGFSYVSEADGAKLKLDLEEIYNSPGGKEIFWDDVPLIIKKDNYKFTVTPCTDDDIFEINSLDDLKKIDPLYKI